jgi:hypothetical protein
MAKKGDEIAAKHGVKMVGFWMVDSEHLNVVVFEAQTMKRSKRGRWNQK